MQSTERADESVLGMAVAPTIGMVLAGIALAAAGLTWTDAPPLVAVVGIDGSAVGLALAGVAVLAFVARRHGNLDRRVGGAVAALASLGVLGVALARLVLPALGGGEAPSVGIGLPIAALAGLLAAALGVADARGIPDEQVLGKLKAASIALGIGLVGYVVSSLVAIVPGSIVTSFGTTARVAVLTTGSGLGLGLFTLGYLRYRDLGLDYIDFDVPDLRDAGYAVGGLVVLFLTAGAVSVVFSRLGLPTAQSSIETLASGLTDPVFLLVLVPLSFLAIGPGEELVYRNIVQKYLYDDFSRPMATVVASVLFGAIHFGQYANPNPVATLATLFVVFVLSLVLGATYYRTENILVPAFVHGAFNALQFVALYVQLTDGAVVG